MRQLIQFLCVLATCVVAPAAELSIPNRSPIGWTPGVDVGIPGGIAAKIAARTVLHDVTQAPFSVANDGSADVYTAINTNVSSVGTDEVLYFPYGLYRFDLPPFLGSQRISVRGAGMGVPSTSSVQIGTGTKVFTVPAGLGWTPGIGTRVWHAQNSYKWMQGTVTSYSGTTLTLNITSTSGDTDTLALWTVGQTVFYRTTNILFFNISAGDTTQAVANITGSPSAGATTITVDSTTGFGAAPQFAQLVMLNGTNGEEYHHWPDPNAYNRFHNVITGISGTTLTLAYPLVVGLPSGQSPKIGVGGVGSRELGFEHFAAFGHVGGAEQLFLNISGAWNSWLYRVELGMGNSYGLQMLSSVGCEVAYSIIGGIKATGDTTSASAWGLGGTNYALIRDSVVKDGLVSEGTPDYNNAFLRNIFVGSYPTLTHGAGSRFRLFEHNIASAIHIDGYHGGTQQDTIFRNWFDGSYAPHGGSALVVLNRYGRKHNLVGNVVGVNGSIGSTVSIGNPSGVGYVEIDPALYVSSSGASGAQYEHIDVSGQSRLTGTATFSGTNATVTLASHTYDPTFLTPRILDNNTSPFHLEWSSGYTKQYRSVMSINRTTSSGSTIELSGGSFAAATTFVPATSAWPSNGTAVTIRVAEYGQREQDLSVEGTMFKKENYLYGASGAAGSIDDNSSDTLPDSLAEVGAPADWPTGTITWPVAISPDSPNVGSAVTPAQFRYLNGYWPEAGGGGGSSATISGTLTVTGTITLE